MALNRRAKKGVRAVNKEDIREKKRATAIQCLCNNVDAI